MKRCEILKAILLFILAIIPSIILGYILFSKDKNKEPKSLLIVLFLGGFGSVFITLFFTAILQGIFPFFKNSPEKMNLIQLIPGVFIGVALIEEFSKWIISYLISYNNKEFDEFYDMIIYCVFVSLGFATFENILYVLQNGFLVALLRCFLAVPGHVCDGIFMGYFLGLSKIAFYNNNKKLQKKNMIYSIIAPVMLHGIYDYCLFSQNGLFILLFFAFIVLLYKNSIKKVKNISSIMKKIKYKNNYCSICGTKVESNYCPMCGKMNE